MARIAQSKQLKAVEPMLERKIYIYAGFSGDQPVVFDPSPIMAHLKDQPPSLEGRYLDVGEGNVVFAGSRA